MNRKKKFKSEISKEQLQKRILDNLDQGIFMPPKRPGIKHYRKQSRAKQSETRVDEVLSKMSNDTLFGDAVKEVLDELSVKDSFDSYYEEDESAGHEVKEQQDTEETNISHSNETTNEPRLRKQFIF